MKTQRVEAVDQCSKGTCPLHASHLDRDLEYTKAGPVWVECLHPSDKTPVLDYDQLKATGFAIPEDCPLHEGPLTLAIPGKERAKGCPIPNHHPTCDCNGEGGDR
jgi:hypothetical protein